MTCLLRTFSTLLALLALGLYGLTGPGAAASGLTAIVICGETGAETLLIDARGNPVEAPDACGDCPDCLSVPPLALAGEAAPAAPVHPVLRVAAISPAPGPAGRSVLCRQARGPPAAATNPFALPPGSGAAGAVMQTVAAAPFPSRPGRVLPSDRRAKDEVAR